MEEREVQIMKVLSSNAGFCMIPKKLLSQCSRVHQILRAQKWKPYIPLATVSRTIIGSSELFNFAKRLCLWSCMNFIVAKVLVLADKQ